MITEDERGTGQIFLSFFGLGYGVITRSLRASMPSPCRAAQSVKPLVASLRHLSLGYKGGGLSFWSGKIAYSEVTLPSLPQYIRSINLSLSLFFFLSFFLLLLLLVLLLLLIILLLVVLLLGNHLRSPKTSPGLNPKGARMYTRADVAQMKRSHPVLL